ncbi:MAG: hypothetical protein Q9216_001643 [Gyalolechia sp. 2 TL-2023]
MVWAWQLWLSPRPRRRTANTSQESFVTSGNAALYETVSKPGGLWAIKETHYIENPVVKAGLSGPPLHIHLRQDEYFKVEQGTLGIITDGVEQVLTNDDAVLFIPAGTRHRFWSHRTASENLVFSAWADPCKDVDHIIDVNFLRNAVGYLADCEKNGLQPSLLQLILFFHNASSLVSPEICNWMPIWLLVWIHIAGAWIAETVLGYERCYPEYTK